MVTDPRNITLVGGTKRFVVVGEGFATEKISNVLMNCEGAKLVAMFTSIGINKKPLLRRIAKRSGVELLDSKLLQNRSMLARLKELKADWLINILSPVIVPKHVLELFPCRAINLHTGPLPEYAGIHVHQWGIRNGEVRFAVTAHQMETRIDSGDIIAERYFGISPTDTGLSLFNKVRHEGILLFSQIIEEIISGRKLPGRSQDLNCRHYYRHCDALDSRIDWRWSAREIMDFVRAGDYRPFKSPTYTATLDSGDVMIFRVQEGVDSPIPPGRFIQMEGARPRIACGVGQSLILTEAADQKENMDAIRWRQYFDNTNNRQQVGRNDDG